jgi:hypothetical protein
MLPGTVCIRTTVHLRLPSSAVPVNGTAHTLFPGAARVFITFTTTLTYLISNSYRVQRCQELLM